MRYEVAVGEGLTTRIDAVACIFCTRVTRQSTTEPTTGRVLFFAVVVDSDIEADRGMEIVGLLFLSVAGVVTVIPMIEARILEL